MEIAGTTAASWEGCPRSSPALLPEEAASGERDEMEVEERHASAPEEADGMEG